MENLAAAIVSSDVFELKIVGDMRKPGKSAAQSIYT